MASKIQLFYYIATHCEALKVQNKQDIEQYIDFLIRRLGQNMLSKIINNKISGRKYLEPDAKSDHNYFT